MTINDVKKEVNRINRFERAKRRAVNTAYINIVDGFGVVKGERENVKKGLAEISENYIKEGKEPTFDQLEKLFELAYNNATLTTEAEFKELRDRIRKTKINIPYSEAQGFPEGINEFRLRNMGRLTLVKQGGISVNRFYQELESEMPGMFPEHYSLADKLMEITDFMENTASSTVPIWEGLDESDKLMQKESLREMFGNQIDNMIDELYAPARLYKEKSSEADPTIRELNMTAKEYEEIYKKSEKIKKKYDRLRDVSFLTKKDKAVLKALESGAIDETQVLENKENILKLYKLQKEYKEAASDVVEYRNAVRSQFDKDAAFNLETSDEWKDKKIGLAYSTETAERNFIDIAGKEEGEKLNAVYIDPIHIHEAQSVRLQNKIVDRIDKLGLKTKEIYKAIIADGKEFLKLKVSESGLVQLLGEKKITEDGLRGIVASTHKDKATIDAVVNRVTKATKEFRKIYDELYHIANNEYIRLGLNPIPYRKDYFPHFKEIKETGLVGWLKKKLGLGSENLPTEIIGRTEAFKPNKRWVGNFLQRTGIGPDIRYDALKGIKQYMSAAMDAAYHAEDIMKLRALARELRRKYSDEGIKEDVKAIKENEEIPGKKVELISEIESRSLTQLNNFAVWLDNYTNIIAGKKHLFDRSMEHEFGRNMYVLSRKLEGRVGANMVGWNLASAMSNVIPVVQTAAEVNPKALAKAIGKTFVSKVKHGSRLDAYKAMAKSIAVDDGFVKESDFLTNRKGVKDFRSDGRLKNADPMSLVDGIVSEIVVRARYYENVKRNMGDEAAIKEADKWAASIMADRSKGSMPTIFYKQNPITKLLTTFQLEVNNQYRHMFKDIPRDERNKGFMKLASIIFRMLLLGWVYGMFEENTKGYKSIFDPIGTVIDTVRSFIPNEKGELDIGSSLVSASEEILREVPFVGSFLGGGRIPISQAFPEADDVSQFGDEIFDDDVSWQRKVQNTWNLLAPSAAVVLPPMGGNQIKKTVEGVNTFVQGGSYTYDKNGDRKRRYDVEQNAENAVRSFLFGQYATPGAQEWVDSGFKTLSAKETKNQEKTEAAGVLDEYLAIKESGDKDGNGYLNKEEAQTYLDKLNIPRDKKALIFSLTNPTVKKNPYK